MHLNTFFHDVIIMKKNTQFKKISRYKSVKENQPCNSLEVAAM